MLVHKDLKTFQNVKQINKMAKQEKHQEICQYKRYALPPEVVSPNRLGVIFDYEGFYKQTLQLLD